MLKHILIFVAGVAVGAFLYLGMAPMPRVVLGEHGIIANATLDCVGIDAVGSYGELRDNTFTGTLCPGFLLAPIITEW